MPFRTGKNYLRFIEHWKKTVELNYKKSAHKVFPITLSSSLMKQRTRHPKKIESQKFHVNSMLINVGEASRRRSWEGTNLWNLYKVSHFWMTLSGYNGKAFIWVALEKSSSFIEKFFVSGFTVSFFKRKNYKITVIKDVKIYSYQGWPETSKW